MSFEKINFLFVIWCVPLLLVFFIYGDRLRKRIVSGFSAPRGLQALIPAKSVYRRWIKATLILTAVLLVAVALAGPQYGYKWEEVEQKGVDLIIALDCSRSMLAEDIQPNRMERAKREIYDLLNLLKGDRAGLVAFAGTAFLQCPLTLDYTAFYLFLDALTPDYLPVGGSDLEAAVSTAISAFDPKSRAEKAIIIITDGEHTGRGDPLQAVKKASEAGIKIFSIGVGNSEGVPMRGKKGGFIKDSSGRIILSKLDHSMLEKMAEKGRGIYVRSVAGDMDLDAIYTKEIRGKMSAVTLEGGRRKVHLNRYQWPLLAAVLLLLLERCLSVLRPNGSMFMFLLAVSLVAAGPVRAGEVKDGIKSFEQGDYPAAIEHFTTGQLEDPERPEILYNLGSAYYKEGDYDTAETHLREALGKADPSLKAKIHYNLGNIDFRQGRMQPAIENYQKALELAPDDQQAKENIDFVKKVMEQQPPQPQNQEDQNQDPNKEHNKDQNSSGQKEGEQGQSKKSDDKSEDSKTDESSRQNSADSKEQPQDGQGASQGEENSDQQEQSASSADKEPEAESPDEGRAANTSAQKTPGDEDKQRAQRLLNRLKDKPGKATMPAHGETPVEKDY